MPKSFGGNTNIEAQGLLFVQVQGSEPTNVSSLITWESIAKHVRESFDTGCIAIEKRLSSCTAFAIANFIPTGGSVVLLSPPNPS